MKRFLFFVFFFLLGFSAYSQVTEQWYYYLKDYSESQARAYFDNDPYLDAIEGIWQSSDGFKYSIEKDVADGNRLHDRFRVIILDTGSDGWEKNEIKAFLSFSSVESIYSMKFYTRRSNRSGLESENLFLVLENPVLATCERSNGYKMSFLKLYPKVDNIGQENNSQEVTSELKEWSGSSIVIGNKYLATNYHVVDGAKSLVVTGINGDTNTDYDVDIVRVDRVNDLAILRISDPRFSGFKPPKYGIKTNTSDVGTDVFVLGYPLITLMGEEIKLTTGVISSKTGFQGDVSVYQISASIQPGNSGGPLFDGQGNLIGIVNAKLTGAENVGYAIKLNYLRNLIESADETIEFDFKNSISSYSLPDKVKHITPYVLMVKANTRIQGANNKNSESGSERPSFINNSDKTEASRLYHSALKSISNRNFAQALDDIEKSIAIYPTSEAYYYRAYAALNLEKYDLMDESYRYCLERKYREEDCYYNIAISYARRSLPERCIHYCDTIISINKKYIRAYSLRGATKSGMDNHEGAIMDYEQAVRFIDIVDIPNEEWADLYNYIAFEHLQLQHITKANDSIKKALVLDLTDGNIWDTYGQVQYQMKDWAGCVNSMSIAIALGKREDGNWLESSYYYRGLADKELGYYSDSYRDLREAAKLNNEDAEEAYLSFDLSLLDETKTLSFSKIIKKPVIYGSLPQDLSIIQVELTEEYTAVHLSYTNSKYDGGWYNMEKGACLIDAKTGEKHHLIAADNCAISPQRTSIDLFATEVFVLYFTPLNQDCEEFDFIESETSHWNTTSIYIKEHNRNKKNNDRLMADDVQVVTDAERVKDLIFVERITKESGWGNAAGNTGRESALKMCKKQAAKKGCDVIRIVDIEYGFTTSVTVDLYRTPKE